MNAHIIEGGTSTEADGIFSTLGIGRDIAADPHNTVAHIIIQGFVAETLLLGEARDCGDGTKALDELLALIGAWADERLANVLADPASRSGRGVILNFGPGRSSCDNHPLAAPKPPTVIGLDQAQQLAQTANQAAA